MAYNPNEEEDLKKNAATKEEEEIDIRKELQTCGTLTNKMWLQRGTWQVVQRYVLPYCGRNLYGFRSDYEDLGQRKDDDRLNSEPYLAVESFVNGVSQGTAPKDREFFAYELPDDDLMEDNLAQLWLLSCRDEVKELLNRGGFYKAYKEFLRELAGFGSANMVIYDDGVNGACYQTDTVGEYVWGLGRDGKVDTCYRRKLYSVRRIMEEFGDEAPEKIKTLWDNGNGASADTNWLIYNCIRKRENYNPKGLGLKQTAEYVSFWFLDGQQSSTMDGNYSDAMSFKDGNKAMKVEYFQTCPLVTARWYAPGNQIYGVGPLTQIIGDAIGLQTMTSREWEAVEKSVAPSMMVPESVRHSGGVNKNADEITFYPGELKPEMIFPLYAGKYDIPALVEAEEKLVRRIKKALYAEALTAMSELAQNKNAAEITAYLASKIYAEKLDQVGPLLELVGDVLEHVLERTFQIAYAQGRIAPPPPNVPPGMVMKTQYISFLFQTQKMAQDVAAIMQGTQFIGEISNISPQVAAAVANIPNWEEHIRAYYRGMNINPRLLNDKQTIQQMNQQSAQQAQQQQQVQAAPELAGAAKDLSQADVGGRNLLEHLTGSKGDAA